MSYETISALVAARSAKPAQPPQYTATETYSDNILGPVAFCMYNLRVEGTNLKPAAPSQSPYIIGSNETFSISVDISFNKTPLTELLMCLGTRVTVDFAFEGYGKAATEVDLSSVIHTVKNKYDYTVTFTGVPSDAAVGLTSGLYEIAAIATIGPVDNECSTHVFGHGYVERVLLEVYPSSEE